MNAMSAETANEGEAEGGPMWGRFFESLGHDDTESVMSGSNVPTDLQHSRQLSRSVSHLVQSPHSEVHPNDSASVVDDDSVLGAYARKKGEVPSITGIATPVAFDGTYVFKFRTPSGRTHRFQARHDDLEHLRDIVAGKLATDPWFTQWQAKDESDTTPDPSDFTLSYVDKDKDSVAITGDDDIKDAVQTARDAGEDRVVLYIQGGKGWEDATAERGARQAAELQAAATAEVKAIEKVEAVAPTPPPVAEIASFAPPAVVHVHEEEKIFGLSKDLLLPASIGALAAVILGVFTISRLTSR